MCYVSITCSDVWHNGCADGEHGTWFPGANAVHLTILAYHMRTSFKRATRISRVRSQIRTNLINIAHSTVCIHNTCIRNRDSPNLAVCPWHWNSYIGLLLPCSLLAQSASTSSVVICSFHRAYQNDIWSLCFIRTYIFVTAKPVVFCVITLEAVKTNVENEAACHRSYHVGKSTL